MDRHSELRVHGVSGTPPRDMLYTDPVSYDQDSRLARVYQRSLDRSDVKAFHWGSLTAGRSVTSLWILLSPFALANVAGWMTVTANTWTRAFGRLAGMALTALFVVQVSHMALDIPYDALARRGDGTQPVLVAALFLAIAVVLVGGLGLLATQSHFQRHTLLERIRAVFSPRPRHLLPPIYWDTTPPPQQWDDPARGTALVRDQMWQVQGLLYRLIRLHLATVMGTLTVVVAYGLDAPGLELTAELTLVAVAAAVLLTTWAPRRRLVIRLTAVAPLAGLGLVAWAFLALLAADLDADSLSASGETTFVAAVSFGAAAALALFGEWGASYRTRGLGAFTVGWNALGVLAVAAFVGASLGLTGALMVEDWTGSAPGGESPILEMGGAWTSVAMLGLAGLLALIGLFLRRRPLAGQDTLAGHEEAAPESPLRRIVLRLPWLLGPIGVYGLVMGVVAWASACTWPARCDATRLPDWDLVWSTGMTVDLFGLTFELGRLTGWTKLLMVVSPALLIFRSIVGGLLKGQETRRKVSILWDVASFWPRWHHPLGPIAYSPHAVLQLGDEIAARRPDILAAHSQGSLIAAVAVAHLPAHVDAPALLTYGSQLGALYPGMFPSVGVDDLVEEVKLRVGGRWINLWRRSDPIGGQYVPVLGSANWYVDTGSGHSYYELAPEYCAARLSLLAGGTTRPTDQEMADCWESG